MYRPIQTFAGQLCTGSPEPSQVGLCAGSFKPSQVDCLQVCLNLRMSAMYILV